MMAGVRLEDLRKAFPDGTVAVHDLTLDIGDHEFLTLLGPSGCGKTTTLRMIAGLESPTSGRIYFGSELVNELPPGRRNVAMVFQSYALYPHMTVAENLEYPLRKRGVAKDKRAARVQQVAALLQLESLLLRRPRQLSGGQQQRVALGRAIIRDPDVFLLDEPLSNLDAALRAYMRAELIQLHRRLHGTMIYVTHDQMEAMTMSTRIAVLDQGRLQQIADPDEIYNGPCNRFVASFVGTPRMNFLKGEIVDSCGSMAFRNGALTVALSEENRQALLGRLHSSEVILGVRPEDVIIGAGDLAVEVAVLEPTGYETIVFLNVGGESIVARAAADVPVKALDHTQVSFRASKLHFFDGTRGERLNARV